MESATTGSGTPPQAAQFSDDSRYQAAIAVERDELLAADMAEWEAAAIADGLTEEPPEKPVL